MHTFTLTLDFDKKVRYTGIDRNRVYILVRDTLTRCIPVGRFYNSSMKMSVKDVLEKIQSNFDKGKYKQYYGGHCLNTFCGNPFPSIHITKDN